MLQRVVGRSIILYEVSAVTELFDPISRLPSAAAKKSTTKGCTRNASMEKWLSRTLSRYHDIDHPRCSQSSTTASSLD